MTDGGAAPGAEAMIERAVQLRREAAGLRQRLEAATRHADTTSGRVQEARDRLTDESEDVARLESLSWTRILSTLKGTRSRPWDTLHALDARGRAIADELVDLDRRREHLLL